MNALQDKVKEQHLHIQRLESEIQGSINECDTFQNLLMGYVNIDTDVRKALLAQFESIKLRLIRTQ